METHTIGVIGAGVMGSGVAQCAAEAGLQVVLIDQSREVLDRALFERMRDGFAVAGARPA